MRVEHHLLALARIGAHEHHPAVAQPDMRDLQCRRYAADQSDLVTPVELVGFARRKAERDVGISRCAGAPLTPGDRVATDRRVAASISESAQILENTGSASGVRAALERRSDPGEPRAAPAKGQSAATVAETVRSETRSRSTG